MVQRRHASTRPALPPVPAPLPDPRERFFRLLHESRQGDLEDIWDEYESLSTPAVVPVEDLLLFADKIAAHAMGLADGPDRFESLMLWGARLNHLLEDLDTRIPRQPGSAMRRTWQIHMASAHASQGNFEEAIAISHTIHETTPELSERSRIANMYHILITALDDHRDAAAVLEFLVNEWGNIAFYVTRRSVLGRVKGPLYAGFRPLQQAVTRIVGSIKYPVHCMKNFEGRPKAWRQRATEILLEMLCASGYAEAAYAVMKEALRQRLGVSILDQCRLVRALAKEGSFVLANPLFSDLPSSMRNAQGSPQRLLYETGLYLFSKQGNTDQAEHYFKQYRNVGGIPNRCIAHLLQAYANAGNAPRVAQLFEEFFGTHDNSVKPNLIHYSTVIYAYAKRGDCVNVNVWLEKMVKSGIMPDAHVYNAVVQAFAKEGDVSAIGAVLEQMRGSKFPPTHITYTTVLALIARRQDPAAAEALFRQALSEGIVPDRKMVTTVMNAYVEAGQWQGVINVFDYLRTVARDRRLGLSIEVYNTLLKAYILIGAPFSVVFKLFHRLQKLDISADQHTYSLVVQSAIDNGEMRYAEELYTQFRRLTFKWRNGQQANVYILTIMMGGHLRNQAQRKARNVYETMIRDGIEPTSVTFHSILKAYSNAKSEASVRVARQFLNDLMSTAPDRRTWVHAETSSRSPHDLIYGPLLALYARKAQTEEVEKLLHQMIDQGGELTLGSLTALLDVHRRNRDGEAALQTWAQIFELGLKESRLSALFKDAASPPKLRRHAHLFALPLSMFLDAMSSTGLHDEIPRVWQELQAIGFTFDAHNWNHLAVALIRAGKVERAFEVIERVILPLRDSIKSMQTDRPREPTTPLLTDSIPFNDADPSLPQPQPPLHAAERRAEIARRTRKQRPYEAEATNEEQDFVHDLHLLRRLSPMWNSWQPHVATVSLLTDTFEHLQSGNIVRPVQPRSAAAAPPPTAEEIEEHSIQAQEVLDRIYVAFPRTVDLVLRFAEWRRTRAHGDDKRLRLL